MGGPQLEDQGSCRVMGCAKLVVNTWKMFLQTQHAVAVSCSRACLSSPSYLNVWYSSGSSGPCNSFLKVTYTSSSSSSHPVGEEGSSQKLILGSGNQVFDHVTLMFEMEIG